MTTSPWTPDRADWAQLLNDQPSYRLDQLWEGLYTHGLEPSEITTLPKELRATIADSFAPGLAPAAEVVDGGGETVKWLWRLQDGAAVETVLMHYANRSTVCVSSQAGCAMGCGFCATGQGGYERNLTVGEIVEQVVRARAAAAPRRLSNIVFMGMGEPFANYDRTLVAVRRCIGDLGIGARHITISTIGLVPQILRFAEEGLQVGLAVSLHAANDELRNELIPINKRHPIADLVAACQLFRERTGRRVSLEWAMISDTNDRDDDADELASVALAARAHVNLIPLNPTPGWPTVGSPTERIARFARRLADRGVTATVRANRGTDIDAACGQLQATCGHLQADGGQTPVALEPKAQPPS
jgi:23S rRNA (adenine2503-C2)-methyltransferase